MPRTSVDASAPRAAGHDPEPVVAQRSADAVAKARGPDPERSRSLTRSVVLA